MRRRRTRWACSLPGSRCASAPAGSKPALILVAPYLHEQLPLLQEAVPGVKLIEMGSATARDIAPRTQPIGVCSADVLGKATRLQWIQWLGAGVETCVQQPLLHERHLLLTNMQRTAAPSMAEHVLGMMLVLSRHLDYFLKEQQQGRWGTGHAAPRRS